tara:strand:+ start:362 stop:469 length:108 start_codon:yes stop_codon:yes gene_type:complete
VLVEEAFNLLLEANKTLFDKKQEEKKNFRKYIEES